MTNNIYDTELKTCDRCGFDHKKSSLRKQRGLWLDNSCYDNIDKIRSPNLRWKSPRDNSNTTTVPPDATPNVFTISSASGINLITQSNELVDRRDGRHLSFFMKVVSDGGNISISANPQIASGTILGDLLTLKGTSDTDSITLVDGTGIRTRAPFTLGDCDTISFVYTNVTTGWGSMAWGSGPWGGGAASTIQVWVETSRFKGGL